MSEDMPTMVCPQCGREEPDFDGFGMLAHVAPGFPNGCGFCTHPSIDDDVCGICGERVKGGGEVMAPKPKPPAAVWVVVDEKGHVAEAFLDRAQADQLLSGLTSMGLAFGLEAVRYVLPKPKKRGRR